MNNILSEQDRTAVLDILVEQLGVPQSQLTPNAKIHADLGGDSLEDVEIAMALEERFHISVPEDLMEGDWTVGDLFQAVEELLAARSSEAAK
jgi:acyl carrier protein